MSEGALYNEIDPFAAEWLENLIAAGQIAPGVVDRRSIEDLEPDYVRRFRQVHLFAGIGIWSAALRRAGWPDDLGVWTTSCPCQPFSAAGAGLGFADERHLWPHAFHLITQCGPDRLLGEQVSDKGGQVWFDLVQADLEAAGFAVGARIDAAAGHGAPHIRQRFNWCGLADAPSDGRDAGWAQGAGHAGVGGGPGGVALSPDERHERSRPARDGRAGFEDGGAGNGVADADDTGQLALLRGEQHGAAQDVRRGDALRSRQFVAGRNEGQHGRHGLAVGDRPGPTNNGWSDADWLFCRDGKWRPVEPGTFPLAHALPRSLGTMGAGLSGLAAMAGADGPSLKAAKRFRTGTLRGFGNAVVLEQTAAFVGDVMEYLNA